MFPDQLTEVWSGIIGTALFFIGLKFRFNSYLVATSVCLGIAIGSWAWVGAVPILLY